MVSIRRGLFYRRGDGEEGESNPQFEHIDGRRVLLVIENTQKCRAPCNRRGSRCLPLCIAIFASPYVLSVGLTSRAFKCAHAGGRLTAAGLGASKRGVWRRLRLDPVGPSELASGQLNV